MRATHTPAILFVLLMLAVMTPVARAQGENPTSIASGQTLTLRLPGGQPVDLTYQAAGPETITVSARSLDGQVDTLLEVYGPEGQLLASNDDAVNRPAGFSSYDSVIESLMLPAAGVYQIRVTTFAGVEAGPVEVAIRPASAQEPTIAVVQPTPVPPPAEVLTLGLKELFITEPLRIQLTGTGPVDLVYVTTGPETISLFARDIGRSAQPMDTTLEIYASDGQQLAANDDLSGNSRDAGIENLALPAGGRYVVRLSTFDGAQVGGVEVEVRRQGVEPRRPEGPNLDVTAELDSSGQTTVRFNGLAGQIVTISARAIQPPAGELDLLLNLYGPSGTQIATDDDSGTGIGLGASDPALVDFTLPVSGEYRLLVSSWFGAVGTVGIKVTTQP